MDEGRRCTVWIFFFFSSRRRHTRFDCDWSSDVCSSDLYHVIEALGHETPAPHEARWISITDVKEGCFVEFRDFAAVQTWIDNLARGNTNEIGRASCRERV